MMASHPEESLVNVSEVFHIPFRSYLGLLGGSDFLTKVIVLNALAIELSL